MNNRDQLLTKIEGIRARGQRETLIRNMAATLSRDLADPGGIDLVCIIGTGYETSNREAVVTWIRQNLPSHIPNNVNYVVEVMRKHLRFALSAAD